jgi:hypothetical protein
VHDSACLAHASFLQTQPAIEIPTKTQIQENKKNKNKNKKNKK